MIKPLEAAVREIEQLPESEQLEAADLLQLFAAGKGRTYSLSDGERSVVRSALREVAQVGFAPDSEVDRILRQPWR